MEDMRRRMVPGDVSPVVGLYFREDCIAEFKGPFLDLSFMDKQVLDRLYRVRDLKFRCLSQKLTPVPHLSAGLGIERRLIKDDLHLIAIMGLGNLFVSLDDGEDLGSPFEITHSLTKIGFLMPAATSL